MSIRSAIADVARIFEEHPIAAPAVTGGALLLVARMHDPATAGKAATAMTVAGVGSLLFAGFRGTQSAVEHFAPAGDLLRTNPAPTAWKGLPPDSPYKAPYECTTREKAMVGTLVPGRRGGVITTCATPTAERPHEGRFWFGLPVAGVGEGVRKSTVRRRLRDAGRPMRADEIAGVSAIVHYTREDPDAVPYPPGLEFPHRVGTSRCDPEHHLWRGHEAAIERAQAAAEARGPRDQAEFSRFIREEMAREPQFVAWRNAADDCAKAFLDREATRRGKAEFSSQREAGQKRARAVASGQDVTAAEYRDTLRSAERKGKRR